MKMHVAMAGLLVLLLGVPFAAAAPEPGGDIGLRNEYGTGWWPHVIVAYGHEVRGLPDDGEVGIVVCHELGIWITHLVPLVGGSWLVAPSRNCNVAIVPIPDYTYPWGTVMELQSETRREACATLAQYDVNAPTCAL